MGLSDTSTIEDTESVKLLVLLQPEQVALIDQTREMLQAERKVGKVLTRQDIVRAAIDLYCSRRGAKGAKQ